MSIINNFLNFIPRKSDAKRCGVGGFTFIEAVAVLGIIAFLAGVVYINLRSVDGRSQDVRIVGQVESLQSALSSYKQDNGYYPSIITPGQALVGPNGKVYLKKIEMDEVSNEACEYDGFEYEAVGSGDYKIKYCLNMALARADTNACVASAGDLCVDCQATCVGKSCGSDGCGGSCGVCSGSNVCSAGACVPCVPSCIGRCAGDSDGCNGDCPACNPCGPSMLHEGLVYETVFKDRNSNGTAESGECWLDRNLGATRRAISYSDTNAFGYLFQWGRLADGHQLRDSSTTMTKSSSNTPGHALFILSTLSPGDWRNPQNNNLWQGVDGINNPCPIGYRIPTRTEWNEEKASWTTHNRSGAYASLLRLPSAGSRNEYNGNISVGSGLYWSSTDNGYGKAYTLIFSGDLASEYINYRASGISVRCIKN